MIYQCIFDRTYILVVIGVLIRMAASVKKCDHAFNRYSRVMSHSGMTGRGSRAFAPWCRHL